MHRVCSLVGGVVMAFTLAGCGDSPPESGTVQFKATQNSPAIEAFAQADVRTSQGQGGMPRSQKRRAKPADTKAAETKKESSEPRQCSSAEPAVIDC